MRYPFIFLLALAGIILICPEKAQSQLFNWQHASQGLLLERSHDVRTAPGGGSFVIGGYQDTCTFLDSTLVHLNPGATNWTAFLARFAENGSLRWLKRFGSQWIKGAQGPVQLSPDSLLIVCSYQNVTPTSFRFDNLSQSLPAGFGFAFLKLDTAGNLGSARFVSRPMSTDLNLETVEPDGNGGFYMGFEYGDSFSIDGTFFPHTEQWDIGLIHYDSSYNVLWSAQGTGLNFDYITELHQDVFDNVYVLGWRGGDLNVAGTTLTDIGNRRQLYLAKYGPDGQARWAKDFSGTHNSTLLCLGTDYVGNVYVAGGFYHSLIAGADTLVSSSPGTTLTDAFLIRMDTNGTVRGTRQWGASDGQQCFLSMERSSLGNLLLLGYQTDVACQWDKWYVPASGAGGSAIQALVDTLGNIIWLSYAEGAVGGSILYSAMTPGDTVYYAGNFNGDIFSLTDTLSSTQPGGSIVCGQASGGRNGVSGLAYLDLNASNSYDTTDVLLSYRNVNYGPQANTLTTHQGCYQLVTGTGPLTVQIANLPHYNLQFQQHNLNFSGTNQSAAGMDFVYQPLSTVYDPLVQLVAGAPAVPGDSFDVYVVAGNHGTVAALETLRFAPDPMFSVMHCDVPPDAVSGDTLIWNVSNILPYTLDSIRCRVLTDTAAAMGTPYVLYAGITQSQTDADIGNNHVFLEDTVVAAFDPNDKLVRPDTALTLAVAATRPFLHYTIRFQNTGTAWAQHVVVRDTLSILLDKSTFEIVSTSHPMEVQIESDGAYSFRFREIWLPDSSADEAGSHGHVSFRIRPDSGLVVGDTIFNHGSIYFDYAAPVLTNATSTPVVETPVAIVGGEPEAAGPRVYPNPAREAFFVEGDKGLGERGMLTLYGMNGQILRQQEIGLGAHYMLRMSVAGLPLGIYLLEVRTGVKRFAFRLRVEGA